LFGTYRTLLALAVAAHHLLSIPVLGHYAVHGFFILSGYLMTYIMHNSYGYSFSGVRSYAENRFLRLYPSYWVVLAITILIVVYWGEDQSKIYREFIYIPSGPIEWIQNITLIFTNLFPGSVYPRLSPPTWALTIELFFYVLIGIGLSRSRWLAIAWLISSLIYMIYTHLDGLGYGYRYSIIFAGSLPFSIGAVVYHYREKFCKIFKFSAHPVPIAIIFSLFLLNSFFGAITQHFKWNDSLFYLSFYFNYIINTIMVISLIKGKFPLISKKFDKAVGDYSYPIYLFHWQAGFMSTMLLWGEPIRGLNPEGFFSFILAIVISIFVSWIIIKFIDHPIQKLRTSIKNKAKKANSLECQKASLLRRFAFYRR